MRETLANSLTTSAPLRRLWLPVVFGAVVVACVDEAPTVAPSGADVSGVPDAAHDVDLALDAGADSSSDLWSFDAGDTEEQDAAEEPPCGGHGHLHGDECHCDAGYIEVGGTCVAPDACAGDDAYEPDDEVDEAVLWEASWTSLERYMCAEDTDMFQVALTAGGRVLVEAETEDPAHVVTLTVWRPDVSPRYGRTHSVATGTEGLTTLNFSVVESGDWLLRVTSATPEFQGNYALSITPVDGDSSPDEP